MNLREPSGAGRDVRHLVAVDLLEHRDAICVAPVAEVVNRSRVYVESGAHVAREVDAREPGAQRRERYPRERAQPGVDEPYGGGG